jgi:SagB-type dehydrogenase family enzyme
VEPRRQLLPHGDLTFAEPQVQDAVLSRRAARGTRPPIAKRYRGAARLPLPPPLTDLPLAAALKRRRTWRQFGDQAVSLAQLSTLLYWSGGVQRRETTESGPVFLKTSPSGGATHANELYVFALDVEGLPRGVYHYAPDRHGLDRIRAGARRREVEKFLPQQQWYRDAAAIVFFAAVFARSQWRYRYARAYRALLIEAGHLCQTFLLTAAALDLAPFCSMALADSAIERALGLDGVSEAVLYTAGVGTRPEGMAWAPNPRDV